MRARVGAAGCSDACLAAFADDRHGVYPQVLSGASFECERTGEIIKAKARENFWDVKYRCFHSGKPPVCPFKRELSPEACTPSIATTA
jgi:hypothetical protein